MQKVTLYQYRDEAIRISVEAYFDGTNLIIDGYDIGERVKEYWGDSDYEYVLTIPSDGVVFLSNYLHVSVEEPEALLLKLAQTFNTTPAIPILNNYCEAITSHAVVLHGDKTTVVKRSVYSEALQYRCFDFVNIQVTWSASV